MTSTKNPTPPNKTNPKAPRRKRQPNSAYSALEKAQAVLTVWTERCKPVEVGRQMGVSWITLQQWQSRAMDGMLQALESRVNLAQGRALSPRLQELLQKQHRAGSTERLSTRLAQLQQSKVVSSPEPAP
jgi:transposase-like protein